MNRLGRFVITAATIATFTGGLAMAHCQIPCGIYGDDARFTELDEHFTTIEKSMNKIVELSSAKEKDDNQLVRWVNNKDEHAEKVDAIITYYFMAQRVKPAAESDRAGYETYVKKLTLLHQMLVASMKAKQTTDLAHVKTLRRLLDEFVRAYGSTWHRE